MTEHRKLQLYATATRLSNIYVAADHAGNKVLADRAHRIKWKVWDHVLQRQAIWLYGKK